MAAPGEHGQQVVVAQGRAYRLVTFQHSAGLELFLRAADGSWISMRRTGGEMGWYGYNRPNAGEVRSSVSRARVERTQRGGRQVSIVSCTLEQGVEHRAQYVAFPDFCIVVSELVAKTPPQDAGLIRLAPRFDIDARRLFCYGFRDGRGLLHTGTLGSLPPRPTYIGVGGWGEGCTVSSLWPDAAYLAFFNPISGPGMAICYPYYKAQWRRAQTFLQLFTGGANYLYAGFFDKGHFNQKVAFAIIAVAEGRLSDIENAVPKIRTALNQLVQEGVVRVPAIEAELRARHGLNALLTKLASTDAWPDKWSAAWRQRWAAQAAARALRLGNPVGADQILARAAGSSGAAKHSDER